jgi:hypothetical protein
MTPSRWFSSEWLTAEIGLWHARRLQQRELSRRKQLAVTLCYRDISSVYKPPVKRSTA